MIFSHFRRIDWILLATTIALVYVQVWMELEIPGYMSKITDIMTSGGTGQDVLNEGVWMLAYAFGSLILSFVTVLFAAYIGTNLGKTLRKRQFEQVERYSDADINRFSIYSLITRSTNDVTQVQMLFIIGLMVMVRAPIMAVMALMKITTKNIGWMEITVFCVLAMVICIAVILWFTFPRFKKIQWMNDDVNRITKESLAGIRVVHAYNAEGFQESKFKEANKTLTDTHLLVTRAMAFLQPVIGTVMTALSWGSTGWER